MYIWLVAYDSMPSIESNIIICVCKIFYHGKNFLGGDGWAGRTLPPVLFKYSIILSWIYT